MLRRRWIVTIVLSLAAHAGVVFALTPEPDTFDEAGSGAGSQVEGTVDAMIGIDMPIDTLSETSADTTVESAAPSEMAETAVAEIIPTEVAAIAPAALVPHEIDAETPVEAAAEIAPAQMDAAAAAELVAATPLETTEAAPIEADLPAAPHVAAAQESAAAVVERPAVASAEPVAAEPVHPTQPVIEAARAIETAEAIEPVAETPMPAPRPVYRIAETKKAAPVDRKAAKPSKPRRGSGDVASRKGAEVADSGSRARDPGRGRSQEAGIGQALKSGYAAKVAAKIRRARKYPAGSRAAGTTQISFRIGAGGEVNGLRVVSSSGDGALDRATLDAVRRAAPFPAPPVSSFAVTVSLLFKPR